MSNFTSYLRELLAGPSRKIQISRDTSAIIPSSQEGLQAPDMHTSIYDSPLQYDFPVSNYHEPTPRPWFESVPEIKTEIPHRLQVPQGPEPPQEATYDASPLTDELFNLLMQQAISDMQPLAHPLQPLTSDEIIEVNQILQEHGVELLPMDTPIDTQMREPVQPTLESIVESAYIPGQMSADPLPGELIAQEMQQLTEPDNFAFEQSAFDELYQTSLEQHVPQEQSAELMEDPFLMQQQLYNEQMQMMDPYLAQNHFGPGPM